jgi:hypothetical protein
MDFDDNIHLPQEEEESESVREFKRKELDRLSLELLSNTSHYKKYLAKTDPEAKHRSQKELARFTKHKSKIILKFRNHRKYSQWHVLLKDQ